MLIFITTRAKHPLEDIDRRDHIDFRYSQPANAYKHPQQIVAIYVCARVYRVHLVTASSSAPSHKHNLRFIDLLRLSTIEAIMDDETHRHILYKCAAKLIFMTPGSPRVWHFYGFDKVIVYTYILCCVYGICLCTFCVSILGCRIKNIRRN